VVREPKCLPAIFTVFDPILHRKQEGITERLNRFLKAQTMLALVRQVLGLVSFEAAYHKAIIIMMFSK